MLGYFSTGHQQRCQGSGLAGAGTISSHWCHRFMQKGGLLRLIEPMREPMKKLSASSRQDVPMRWRAEVCSLSPRWGSCYPPLLLVTVALHPLPTPFPLHTTVLTPPLLPPSQTGLAALGHTAVPRPPCGHTCAARLCPCAALRSQSSTLLWGIGVFGLPQLCQ